MKLLKKLEVSLGSRSYAIEIGTGLLCGCGEKIAELVKGRQAAVITDSNVGPLYQETVRKSLEQQGFQVTVVVIPAGESSKSWQQAEHILTVLLKQKFHRDSCVVALGGGVVGDLAGFVASIYQRGVAFFQIPTSLLAQVDSSVGGKTGVDFQQYKNMVGAFHQPRLVYMNMNTLNTLPETEFICGMGEVLKTGLICDSELFRSVCRQKKQIRGLDSQVLASVIRRCCEIKAGVVERDPKEQGERALLNLGHTIGHAVEKLMDFQLLHGQCVAVGTIAAAAISRNRGLLSEKEYQEILCGCRDFGLPVSVQGLDPEKILEATRNDKKMEQGHIKFILMKGIGNSFIDKTLSDQEILKGIQEILQ